MNFTLGEIFNHINFTFNIKMSNANQLNHKPNSINLEVVSFVECFTAINETIRKKQSNHCHHNGAALQHVAVQAVATKKNGVAMQ